MEINEENTAWAASKLAECFSDYPGFPTKPKALQFHARDFLRIVRNKPIGEIIQAARKADRLSPINEETGEAYPTAAHQKQYRYTAGQIDVDWLLETLITERERYPLPPQVRTVYSRIMPPEDGIDFGGGE